MPIMAVLDPEHTLDLGNTESSTICYHASYNMLSCILPVAITQQFAIMQPFAIMQNTICYHAKSCNISFASCNISFASWDISFAIMQIILCYHAGYHMLLCGVLTFYHNYYQPPRLTYYYQVIIIASSGALPFDLTGTYKLGQMSLNWHDQIF
jgi:hypothetical protein